MVCLSVRERTSQGSLMMTLKCHRPLPALLAASCHVICSLLLCPCFQAVLPTLITPLLQAITFSPPFLLPSPVIPFQYPFLYYYLFLLHSPLFLSWMLGSLHFLRVVLLPLQILGVCLIPALFLPSFPLLSSLHPHHSSPSSLLAIRHHLVFLFPLLSHYPLPFTCLVFHFLHSLRLLHI